MSAACLYITADRVGIQTGGGLVTHHECEALRSLDDGCVVLDGVRMAQIFKERHADKQFLDPWEWDTIASEYVAEHATPKLAHIYAGTFTKTVALLRARGCIVTYTAAAHSVNVSRREHAKLGIPYNYPHMTDPDLFARYVRGYLDADRLICPSTQSADAMYGFGAKQSQVSIIPHGCEIPMRPVVAPPVKWTLGYLGAVGPDKGLVYLLGAWKKLSYYDATLRIAGPMSASPYMVDLVRRFGGGNIQLCGWVDSVSDFFNGISCYVQPSATEGFGIEVVEALAHGRPVICSYGAGAADLVPWDWKVVACDEDALANKIADARTQGDIRGLVWYEQWREHAVPYTWDKIRACYVDVWKRLLTTSDKSTH